jgi:hypothetical protein
VSSIGGITVAGFGINVTLVEQGGYATDWAGPSSKRSVELPAYNDFREKAQQQRMAQRTATRGDPKASAAAILRVVDADVPPLRVFFGTAPLSIAEADYASRLDTWRAWQDVSELAQG